MFTETLFSETELAKLLGLTPGAVAQNRRDGVGPKYLRIRRRIRYRGADIQQWVEQRMTNPELNEAAEITR